MKARGFQGPLYRVARLDVRQQLHDDPQVKFRLAVLEKFEELNREHGVPVRDAARLVGVPRSTLYDWRRRYRRRGLAGLLPRSRRPRRVRRRQWDPALRKRLVELRRQYPGWGKRKLTVLLRREGWAVSENTVGRILSDLLRRGRIERSPRRVKRRRKPRTRTWATRGWAGLRSGVGRVLQLDTMSVGLCPGVSVKQFTAVDVASRYLVGALFRRATAKNARAFLSAVLNKMPFPVERIQVDGGSEFCAEFEAACAELGLPLIVLPPYSPRMNTRVEYVHGTCRRELYECVRMEEDLQQARRQWAKWETVYNRIRPHESLDLMTPLEYVKTHSPSEACSDM